MNNESEIEEEININALHLSLELIHDIKFEDGYMVIHFIEDLVFQEPITPNNKEKN